MNKQESITPGNQNHGTYQVPQQLPIQPQQQFAYVQTPQTAGQPGTQQVVYQQVVPNQQISQYQQVQQQQPYYLQPQQMQPQFVSYVPQHQQQPQYPPHQYIPAQAPAFLDQRCFNLVKAKKGLKRWGKCQVYGSYILIFFNALSVLQNLFVIFTSDSWSVMPVQDESGKVYMINLGQSGIVLMSILKIIANLLFIRWGVLAIRTYKPIIKDIHRQEMQGIQPGQELSNGQYQYAFRSQNIKEYKRKAIKIILASFVILFITVLYTRSYFIGIADDFLDQEYARKSMVPSYPGSNSNSRGSTTYPSNDVTILPYPLPEDQQGQHKKGKMHGGKKGKHTDDNVFNIDFNFDNMGLDEAKASLHSIINIFSIGMLFYSACLMGCFSGCCLFAINKTKNLTKIQEEYFAQSIPGQMSMVAGINNNGFQQVPVGDTSIVETEAAYNQNQNVIPRGVVVNSIN